jgi:hypothetical protein
METLPEQLSRTLMTIAKACAVMLVVASLWRALERTGCGPWGSEWWA